VRELLRDALGDQAVDELTPRQIGRILGALFSAAQRELDTGNPDQLQLHPSP
jgi:hypothetical protein